MTNTEKITHEIMDRHLNDKLHDSLDGHCYEGCSCLDDEPYVHANILGESSRNGAHVIAQKLAVWAVIQTVILAVVVIGWYIGKWRGWF